MWNRMTDNHRYYRNSSCYTYGFITLGRFITN